MDRGRLKKEKYCYYNDNYTQYTAYDCDYCDALKGECKLLNEKLEEYTQMDGFLKLGWKKCEKCKNRVIEGVD